jgi:hypothetical protein
MKEKLKNLNLKLYFRTRRLLFFNSFVLFHISVLLLVFFGMFLNYDNVIKLNEITMWAFQSAIGFLLLVFITVTVTYLIHILYLLLIKTNINKDFLLEEHLYNEYIGS